MILTVSDTYLDEAAELERLGYPAIWLPGGQIDSLGRYWVLPLVTSATCVSRSERGPPANQDLACFWWHGTANLS